MMQGSSAGERAVIRWTKRGLQGWILGGNALLFEPFRDFVWQLIGLCGKIFGPYVSIILLYILISGGLGIQLKLLACSCNSGAEVRFVSFTVTP